MGKQCDAFAYYWEDQGGQPLTWPGLKMDHVSGNTYKIEVPANCNKIIFSEDSSGGNQTDDLDVPGDGATFYKNSNSWDSNPNPGPGPGPDPIPGGHDFANPRTIVVIDDGNWGNALIHYWSDSSGSVWPGVAMTSIGQLNGKNAYVYVLEDQYSKFVINNGSGTQSADLNIGSGYMAFYTASNSYGDASSFLK